MAQNICLSEGKSAEKEIRTKRFMGYRKTGWYSSKGRIRRRRFIGCRKGMVQRQGSGGEEELEEEEDI